MYESVNGGENWGAVNTGSTVATCHLAFDPVAPQTIYAGSCGKGVYKSVNGGKNWSSSSSGLTDLDADYLTVDPSNPQTIYAATPGGAFRSTNGGSSWIAINKGFTSTFIYMVAIDPADSRILYAGTSGGGGIFKATVAPAGCSGSGASTIVDVQNAINMLLGLAQPSTCIDLDGNNHVSVYELQKATNSFLGR